MTKSLSTQKRAARQRIMMSLRSWMEREGISRAEMSETLGITRGHLSTLINANRTPTEKQCQQAIVLMGSKTEHHEGRGVRPAPKRRDSRPAAKKKVKKRLEGNGLRPMTEFETKFVTDVAKAWIAGNKGASRARLIEVVRDLSIGIRT